MIIVVDLISRFYQNGSLKNGISTNVMIKCCKLSSVVTLSLTLPSWWMSPVDDTLRSGRPGVSIALSRCIDFYPRDAMLARVIEISTCLSVRHAPVLCQNEES